MLDPVAAARSPLEARAADLGGIATATGGTVEAVWFGLPAQVGLRVDPAIARTRGLALPFAPNTVLAAGPRAAIWLGPDEWLLLGAPGAGASIVAELERDLEGAHAAVTDLGANRAWLELRGPGVRDLLSRGVPIDLHPRSWTPGDCAQTVLARTQVLLVQAGDDLTRVAFRPSFADYVVDWLVAAAVA
jgi:sarcosine oxidase subunit gamma